MRILANMIIIL